MDLPGVSLGIVSHMSTFHGYPFENCTDVCPSGSEYVAGTDSCSACQPGTYRTQNEHNQCQPCAARFTTVTDRAESEDECVRKSYCCYFSLNKSPFIQVKDSIV